MGEVVLTENGIGSRCKRPLCAWYSLMCCCTCEARGTKPVDIDSRFMYQGEDKHEFHPTNNIYQI